MNKISDLVSKNLTVSSKDVADHFGRVHRDVLRAIEEIIKETGRFGSESFAHSTYTSLQNKKLPQIIMNRDGFCFLVMGFTGKKATEWKIKYLEAFNKMEAMLKGEISVMAKLNEAIKLMEEDKQIASGCGSGLAEWRKVRKNHIKCVEDLTKEAQLILNFNKDQK